MVIAIDGVAGAGKSTLSKGVSQRLGFTLCSAGSIYRAIALKTKMEGINPSDAKSLRKMLEKTKISFEYIDGNSRTLLDGRDVSNLIRSIEISELTPRVAGYNFVREFVRKIQHQMSKKHNIIVEGRDIGTVVFPNAELKFFVTASDNVRAERRREEYRRLGEEISLEQALADVLKRDKSDSTRELSPLKKADDAVVFDNSNWSVEEALDRMTRIIQENLKL